MPSAPDFLSRAPICFCDLSCFFTPQLVPAKAALFQRGELSAERLTEGCWDWKGGGLCVAKKARMKFEFSKPKICTFFLCGSAVRHYMPSSGRKVSRASVTEGAGETERRQKAAVFRV